MDSVDGETVKIIVVQDTDVYRCGDVLSAEILELNTMRVGSVYFEPGSWVLAPDPVCVCGKTSEGLCPRCGQDMG